MLPDFRFVIGATAAAALLGLTGLGLFESTRLSRQANKMGPLETARSQSFTDHSEWNQFYDADSVRRFVGLGRKAETAEPADVAPERRAGDSVATVATAVVPLEAREAGSNTETIPALAAGSVSEEIAANPAIARPAEPTPLLATPVAPEPPNDIAVLESTDVNNQDIAATAPSANAEAAEVKASAADAIPSVVPAMLAPPVARELRSAEVTAPVAAVALAPSTPEGTDSSAAHANDLTWDKETWDSATTVVAPQSEPQTARDYTPSMPAAPAISSGVDESMSEPVRGLRQGESPARSRGHLDHLLPAKSKVRRVSRHAVLSYAELPEFITRLRAQEGMAARALEFTILTAARPSETIGAVWDEMNMSQKVWIVPAARMKSGKEYRVPMSPRALAILRDEHDMRTSDYVFPGGKAGKPLSNMGSRAYQLCERGCRNGDR